MWVVLDVPVLVRRWTASGTTGTGRFGLVQVLVEVLVPGCISFSEIGVHFLPSLLLGLFSYDQIRFLGPIAEVIRTRF